jgi:hypothetical protein
MTVRQLLVISTSTFLLLTLPCQAGPCSKDIDRIQASIDTRLNALAAAGPPGKQSVGAQIHRQPTPITVAEAEGKLEEVPSSSLEKVKDAMARARNADNIGDKGACESALADVQRAIGPPY